MARLLMITITVVLKYCPGIIINDGTALIQFVRIHAIPCFPSLNNDFFHSFNHDNFLK